MKRTRPRARQHDALTVAISALSGLFSLVAFSGLLACGYVLQEEVDPSNALVDASFEDGREDSNSTPDGSFDVNTSNSCSDGIRNGDETDVDCGGSCAGCALGSTCLVATDCLSGPCTGTLCVDAGCTDGVQNGFETDVDCGGTGCAPCAVNSSCITPTDCATQVCMGLMCQAPTCTDGATNGAETDVDCGGGTCPACANGDACLSAGDCLSGRCTGNVCEALPTCSDAITNGTETDVDCGGATCAACGAGQMCLSPSDCSSNLCSGNVCQAAPTCSDAVQNGTETDVDCGGATCAACADGDSCVAPNDCVSGVCTGNTCRAPTCSDGVQNGTESGIDCGGSCPACGGSCLDWSAGFDFPVGAPVRAGGVQISSALRPTLNSAGTVLYAAISNELREHPRISGADFGPGVAVPGIDTTLGAAISVDTLTAVAMLDRPADGRGSELYLYERASTAAPFVEIRPLAEVNTIRGDWDSWLALDLTRLYAVEEVWGGPPFNIYAVDIGAGFSLGPKANFSELQVVDQVGNPSLTANELVIVFNGNIGGGQSRLYYATRPSIVTSWSSPQLFPGGMSNVDAREPFLSADGCELFYTVSDSVFMSTYRRL